MAGRGTDIQLGGNLEMRLWKAIDEYKTKHGREPSDEEERAMEEEIKAEIAVGKKEALAAGGLFVLGTERHESRRIDNQLRGRTGRQGDPGKSKFFISVEDDLMRVFAADRLNSIMKSLGIKEDEGITHPWMNKAIETSQKKIEERNFEIRKNVLKYDDVINDQRKAIFEQRREFMHAEAVTDDVTEMRHDVVDELVSIAMPEKAFVEQWDVEGLTEELKNQLALDLPIKDWAAEEGVANAEIAERIRAAADEAFENKVTLAGGNQIRQVEKQVLLQVLDQKWRNHLQQIDQLRSVIHLRSYDQRDPLNEFKEEAFKLFNELLSSMRIEVTRILMNIRIAPPPTEDQRAQMAAARADILKRESLEETHLNPDTGDNEMTPDVVEGPNDPHAGPPLHQAEADWSKTPRNAACPCGSGKKYKHCHGSLTGADQRRV